MTRARLDLVDAVSDAIDRAQALVRRLFSAAKKGTVSSFQTS